MIETQILVLTELAARDGEIDEKEQNLIMKIGNAHGLTDDAIEDLMDQSGNIDYDSLAEKDRFDMLYHVVQLMKVDGKIFDEEISYCMSIAQKLGYPLEAVMELYGFVHANIKFTHEINSLKRKYSRMVAAA
ncbi:MAG: TerB family tellurite resistance protein [Cyclobacteriaceae bacterium]|nr:TerB family tellurite resistance protein [Cyclobacteriaceae bacterium HetDA_MAG_MS6]